MLQEWFDVHSFFNTGEHRLHQTNKLFLHAVSHFWPPVVPRFFPRWAPSLFVSRSLTMTRMLSDPCQWFHSTPLIQLTGTHQDVLQWVTKGRKEEGCTLVNYTWAMLDLKHVFLKICLVNDLNAISKHKAQSTEHTLRRNLTFIR